MTVINPRGCRGFQTVGTLGAVNERTVSMERGMKAIDDVVMNYQTFIATATDAEYRFP